MKSVKELRSDLGMSIVRFAEFTGIPYRTIQNWENGSRECSDYVLAMLNEQIRPYVESFDLTYKRYTWIASEESRGDEQIAMFLTKESALTYAESVWNHLTDSEKKESSVCIGMCEIGYDPDYEKIYPDTSDGIFYQEYMK